MLDPPAQDQLFMVLLVLSVAMGWSPCSQEGCGPTIREHPILCNASSETALAKVTQSRGKREMCFASTKRSIISLSPAPHGVLWPGEGGT